MTATHNQIRGALLELADALALADDLLADYREAHKHDTIDTPGGMTAEQLILTIRFDEAATQLAQVIVEAREIFNE